MADNTEIEKTDDAETHEEGQLSEEQLEDAAGGRGTVNVGVSHTVGGGTTITGNVGISFNEEENDQLAGETTSDSETAAIDPTLRS